MSTHPRDPRKEQFWRRQFEHWRRSGLSVRAFCARHGLSEPTFYSWRRTLAQRDDDAVPFVPVQVGTAVSKNPAIAALTKPKTISWPCQEYKGGACAGHSPPVRTQKIIATGTVT